MDLLLFCTAFIVQFVGHRIGDYLFQTDWQAQNKTKSIEARFEHCWWYSFTIAALTSAVLGFDASILLWLFVITLIEHMIIDSRKPIVWWKTFLETKIAGQKSFNIEKLPFFVLIEIDQSVHYVRIFVISILIGFELL